MASAAKSPGSFRFARCVRAALLASVAACRGGDGLTWVDHRPSRIDLSASSMTAWVGDRYTLRAHVFDAAGNEVYTSPVQWQSDDPAIASVDSLGIVTPRAEGRTTVTASTSGVRSAVAVEVLEVARVEIDGPVTLTVNQSAALQVTGHASSGEVITNPSWARVTSSDSSLLEVIGGDTVRGLRRGTASVSVRLAQATATIAMNVGARLRLDPPYAQLRMNVEDTLQLSAVYVDVNGVAIPEKPVVVWRSNYPGVVTVSSHGGVRATEAAMARIYAATSTDTVFADLSVDDLRPGQATTVRYVHALRGKDPITFTSSGGDTVTLAFGESVTRPIAPGTYLFHADVPGQGQTETQAEIRDGDQLTVYALYAMGATPSQGYLQHVWSRHQSLPPEWGKLRVVQGSEFLTYFLRPRGQPLAGLPEECYFDGGNVHEPPGAIAPGDYDIVATTKYGWGNTGGPVEIARVPAAVPPGRTITAVLLGRRADDAGVLTFPDP